MLRLMSSLSSQKLAPATLFRVSFLAAILASMPAHAAPPAVPQETAREEGDVNANAHDLVQGSHVEGHIAFLKAELAITPEQEALWAPVAAAMREDVKSLQEAENHTRHQVPSNALQYLENRVAFANLRAEGEDRFLTALRPLYAALSSHQKQMADSILIPDSQE